MSVVGRLPNNVQICTFGLPLKISISVTLETSEHAQALIDAVDILMPLFEKSEVAPNTSDDLQ